MVHRPCRGGALRKTWLLPLLLAALQPQLALSQDAGNLYCGKDDCYGVLEVARSAETAEIKKVYRKLAMKWHPDKNRSPKATEKFQRIGRAYEVLSDEKLRAAYNYYLDHPEQSYQNYARYYYASYSPKTPLWMVISGALLFMSGLQYFNQSWRYSSTQRIVKMQLQFKRRVNEVYEAEVAKCKGKLSKAEKEVMKERCEREVLENEVVLNGSGGKKPDWRTLVGVKAVLLPYTLSVAFYQFFQWHWRFSIKGEAYGEKERIILTRRALGMNESLWGHLEEHQREEFLSRNLWEGNNLKAFYAERQEEQKEKLQNSAMYRRYVREKRKDG